MKKSKIKSEVVKKSKIKSEVVGQSAYKFFCPNCGNEWYDTYSSSQCPKCGAWGRLQ